MADKGQTMEPTEPIEFMDVRIKVPWGHIAGRWYGSRQLRPILAIHGWMDNIGTWERLIPLMPQHIGVLCIELPGHGQSSHLPRGMSYHTFDFARIIGHIMQEYKWKKVSLMGHSLGSIVCYIYTALFPQRVDLIVAIDALSPLNRSPTHVIRSFKLTTERILIEDEHLELMKHQEPPVNSYAKLEHLLYEATNQSVTMENCKYLLDRNITKSSTKEDKYYFVRDGRLKNYTEFRPPRELTLKMVKNIVNMPYLVIKASEQSYINEDTIEIIEMLRQQNPDFELHKLEGKHHIHLNKPKDVAAILNPFINQHRPARSHTSSLVEDVAYKQSVSLETEQPKVKPKPSSKL